MAMRLHHATRRLSVVETFEHRFLLDGTFPNAAAVAMAYDAGGGLHVAYQNAGADTALHYASRTAAGTWSAETTVDPALAAGSQLAVGVNAAGAPGIAYYDPANGDLKYAVLSGGAWQVAVVDFKGDVGQHPAIAFDNFDRPLISHYGATKQDLKLTTFNGKRWKSKVVDGKKDTGRHSSIDVNPVDGAYGIVYEATTTGQVKVRSKSDKKVVLASWAPGGELAAAPAIAFDAAGTPAVSFVTPGTDTLVLYRPAQVTRKKRVWNGTAVTGGAMAAGPGAVGFGADGLPAVVYTSAAGDVQLASQVAGTWSSVPVGSGSAFAFDPPRQTLAVLQAGEVRQFSPGLPAPATLNAALATPTGVDLSWDAVPGATGYVVQRARSGGAYATLTTTGPQATTYLDATADEGENYSYRVFATADASASLNAAVTSAATPLRAVTGLTAAPGQGGIALQWTDGSSRETGYSVERSADGGPWTPLVTLPANTTTYTDTAAGEGTAFSYTVRPMLGGTSYTGAFVGPVTISIYAPANLSAAAPGGSAGQTQINLTWNDASAIETGYRVERSTDGTSWIPVVTTAANATGYNVTGLASGRTHYFRVRTEGASIVSDWVVASADTAASGAPNFVLTPIVLAALRAKAAATSGPAAAQWAAFKTLLDNELGRVTSPSYQADQVEWASDFALGYQALKLTDPATASAYADKAIAMMLSGVRDNARNNTGTRMFLARGNGTTTQFPLPHTAIKASTVKVWTAAVTTKAVTKGAANGQDTADTYTDWLKVSLTPDGPADYVKGVDWRFNPDYRDDKLDWSLPGNEPAPGTTYYVTEASSNGLGQASGWTLTGGNTITFATAPAANRAVWVEYQYGTPSGGASTLGYQQTSDGRGGFNNVLIDSGYTTRFLKHAAIALDWLWDYPGLSSSIRSEVMSVLVKWSDAARDNLYQSNSPASNYGAGHFALRTAVALALRERSPEAARLEAEVKAYRLNRVLPILDPPANGKGTEYGGSWAEGWNYGALAVRNIISSGIALEAAGWTDAGGAAPERAWATDVIRALLVEQPTQATVYDGGDGYAYPLPFPNQNLLTDLAYATPDAAVKSYANYTLQNYSNSVRPGWEQVLYRTPDAPAAFWGGALPLQYLSAGTGLGIARKDWNYNSTWLTFHSGNQVEAEHQQLDQGGILLHRGADALLVNVAAVTGEQTFQNKSIYGNLVVIDDGGAGEQTYRFAQGNWYGNPGVTMPHFDGTADYVYMQGNYRAAYTHHYGEPGAPNPASELVRNVFYVRNADYVVVYDRATTTQPGYLKQLRWHFTGTAAITGDAWTITAGSSKLFAKTYSSEPLTTATQTLSLAGTSFKQITTNNSNPIAGLSYVTAMQTAPSSTAAMDASQRVASGDGKVEGARLGNYAILFGRHGAVSGGTSYAVTAGAGQAVTHYVSDLAPGVTYVLTGADQASAAANAQGVLTFTSTGTGTAQTVTLTPPGGVGAGAVVAPEAADRAQRPAEPAAGRELLDPRLRSTTRVSSWVRRLLQDGD
jgi:hypothetical protein